MKQNQFIQGQGFKKKFFLYLYFYHNILYEHIYINYFYTVKSRT